MSEITEPAAARPTGMRYAEATTGWMVYCSGERPLDAWHHWIWENGGNTPALSRELGNKAIGSWGLPAIRRLDSKSRDVTIGELLADGIRRAVEEREAAKDG